MFRHRWVCFLLLLTAAPSLLAARQTPEVPTKPWYHYAERLTGESDWVRERSLEALGRIPQIEGKLLRALDTPNRGLALDAIAGLGLRSLVPTLLRASDRDGEGAVHLTLNALIDEKLRPTLAARYRDQLLRGDLLKLSAASVMAILDGLKLMGEALEPEVVDGLILHPSYEVRSAALLYATELTEQGSPVDYQATFHRALRSNPRQLRLEAIASLSLPGPRWALLAQRLLPFCRDDADPQVREACRKALPPAARTVSDEADLYVPRDLTDLYTQKEKRLRSQLRRERRAHRSCPASYRAFFASGDVDLRIVLGYKDARPARFVGDRYERAALVEHLLRPCPPHYLACGFQRAEDDGELLVRWVAGPDGEPARIRLRVVDSSLSPDDDYNRAHLAQELKTARAREVFLEGLRQAQAVLYLGHSRDGGGPDFGPPRIFPHSHHVNYPWYRAHRWSWQALLSALGNAENRPRLLGLFSCFADLHFTKTLRERFPRMGLVASRGWAYTDDEVTEALGTLSSLLSMECRPGFERALDPGRDPNAPPARVLGFFKGSGSESSGS